MIKYTNHAIQRLEERLDLKHLNYDDYGEFIDDMVDKGERLNDSDYKRLRSWANATTQDCLRYRNYVGLFDRDDDNRVLITILTSSQVGEQILNYSSKHLRNKNVLDNPKGRNIDISDWPV